MWELIAGPWSPGVLPDKTLQFLSSALVSVKGDNKTTLQHLQELDPSSPWSFWAPRKVGYSFLKLKCNYLELTELWDLCSSVTAPSHSLSTSWHGSSYLEGHGCLSLTSCKEMQVCRQGQDYGIKGLVHEAYTTRVTVCVVVSLQLLLAFHHCFLLLFLLSLSFSFF